MPYCDDFIVLQNNGFFCFSFKKRSPRDTLGKLSFLDMLFLKCANQQIQLCNVAFHVKTS